MAIYRNGAEWGVATIDVTLGFFNHLAKEMGEAIHGRVLIVEANGKVVGNAALVNGTPKLQNLSDLTLPMAAPLKALLASAGSQPVQSQYRDEEGDRTLFVQQIAGSPGSGERCADQPADAADALDAFSSRRGADSVSHRLAAGVARLYPQHDEASGPAE